MSYRFILNRLIFKLDKVFKEIKIGNSIIKFSSNRHISLNHIFTLTIDHSCYTQKIQAINDGTNRGYIVKIENIYDNCNNISYKKNISLIINKNAFYFINEMMRKIMHCGCEIDFMTGNCLLIKSRRRGSFLYYYEKYESVLDIKRSNIDVALLSYLLKSDF